MNWKVWEEGGSALPWYTAVTNGKPQEPPSQDSRCLCRDLSTHKPLSSLLCGESYEQRTVSWLQVECSPQMGQVRTYCVCSCVLIQIGSTDCEHVWRKRDVCSSTLAISLLAPSVHIGDCTKNWFSDSCSCSKVKKTGIFHHRRHVTSCTLLPEYMTSLHGRVTSRVLQHDHMSPFTEDL
jgi:hypothetical protein